MNSTWSCDPCGKSFPETEPKHNIRYLDGVACAKCVGCDCEDAGCEAEVVAVPVAVEVLPFFVGEA